MTIGRSIGEELEIIKQSEEHKILEEIVSAVTRNAESTEVDSYQLAVGRLLGAYFTAPDRILEYAYYMAALHSTPQEYEEGENKIKELATLFFNHPEINRQDLIQKYGLTGH